MRNSVRRCAGSPIGRPARIPGGRSVAGSGLRGGVVGFEPEAWSVVSRTSVTSGSSSKIIRSMPAFSVTSGRAAALAAARHPDVDRRVLDVDQLDEAAVAGDRRVDRGVEQLLHLSLRPTASSDIAYPPSRACPADPDRGSWVETILPHRRTGGVGQSALPTG